MELETCLEGIMVPPWLPAADTDEYRRSKSWDGVLLSTTFYDAPLSSATSSTIPQRVYEPTRFEEGSLKEEKKNIAEGPPSLAARRSK